MSSWRQACGLPHACRSCALRVASRHNPTAGFFDSAPIPPAPFLKKGGIGVQKIRSVTNVTESLKTCFYWKVIDGIWAGFGVGWCFGVLANRFLEKHGVAVGN